MLTRILEEAWREGSRAASDVHLSRTTNLTTLIECIGRKMAGIAWENPLVAAYVRDSCRCYLVGVDLGCAAHASERLYVHFRDSASPIPFGREASAIRDDYKLELFDAYRRKYNLTYSTRDHHASCQFVRVVLTDNPVAHGILKVSSQTAGKLKSVVPTIRDICRQGVAGQARLEAVLGELLQDDDLRSTMDRAALQLESALFGTVAEENGVRPMDRNVALRHVLFSLWFHLNREQYHDQELEALWFPIDFGSGPHSTAVVLLGCSRVLSPEDVFGSMQLWRNIILPFMSALRERP